LENLDAFPNFGWLVNRENSSTLCQVQERN
jgi:hypothetical protein